MSVIKEILALRKLANEHLDAAIEAEMWKVANRKSIGTVLKCMGEVTLYNRKGDPFDLHGSYAERPPEFCRRLFELAALDTDYYSLTGHPLKIYKGANGQLLHTRDW